MGLADQDVGKLVRLDHIYDLVEGNISSEVRAKIAGISDELAHPLATPVAKTICLLQFVKSVHRDAENIAAALYPSVGADSQLAAVKEALARARDRPEGAPRRRRLPHPHTGRGRLGAAAQPDEPEAWRRASHPHRGRSRPSGSHSHRTSLLGVKTFKAGLAIDGRAVESGDVVFQLHARR